MFAEGEMGGWAKNIQGGKKRDFISQWLEYSDRAISKRKQTVIDLLEMNKKS